MSAGVRLDDTTITNLKHELKEWEKLFAGSNGGRKPGRADIKRDAIVGMIVEGLDTQKDADDWL